MQAINFLHRMKWPLCIRCWSKNSLSQNKILFENLSIQRSLLRVTGHEVFEFLQGLTTNDMFHLKTPGSDNAIFTMFLNKQGRVLYDAIIYKRRNEDSTVLIECDRAVQNELKQHLTLFRVRKKIYIDILDHELSIWVRFIDSRSGNKELNKTSLASKIKYDRLDEQILGCHDPRLPQLGMRIIAPSNFNIRNFQNLEETTECLLTDQYFNYIKHRYLHGVCEGASEIPTLKVFPFEANCDYLHGISFQKGCYLGQEFTARTYHTGVVRKRIMPIIVPQSNEMNIDFDAPILNENNLLIGKFRGIQNEYAIGSLKIDNALQSKYLRAGNLNVSTFRPPWWPKK